MTDSAAPSIVRTVLKHDLPASLVTFLVAVPLSMGIALASNASVVSGLIAAMIGGILVGALSGAPLQVSGPAAGLVVMVFNYVAQYGFAAVAAITVAAGVIQVLLGFARIARVALAISPAVIHGMLAAIGLQITLAQLHVVLGGKPQSSAFANLKQLPGQIASLHGTATLIGLVAIALLLAWPFIPSARVRAVPAPLVAITVATIIGVLIKTTAPRVHLPSDLLGALTFPAVPAGKLQGLLGAAVSLAIVASAESLLSAIATDNLHTGRRANLDRELIAQGVGNVASGFLGGLPITGVVVRSTANISAGARTRAGTILHGVWVVLFVTSFGFLIALIPMAALAGLLVVVGVRLVNIGHIKELHHHKELPVYIITLVGVLVFGLLQGIGIGVAVAIFSLLRRLTRVHIAMTTHNDQVSVVIKGALTFVSVPKLTASLRALPEKRNVEVDLDVDMIDHAAFEALHNWRVGYERQGGTVDMDQLHEAWGPGKPSRFSVHPPAQVAS